MRRKLPRKPQTIAEAKVLPVMARNSKNGVIVIKTDVFADRLEARKERILVAVCFPDAK